MLACRTLVDVLVIAVLAGLAQGKPLQSSEDENAFDKITQVDSKYEGFTSNPDYDGDMKLPPVKHSRTRRSLSGDEEPWERKQVQLWPGGVVPYLIGEDLKRRPSFVKKIEQAMEGWERRTCIKFKERTTETDYVMLYFGPGCQSDVGRVGGFQTTSLGEGCNDYGIITHELGHLIGLYHEQNRPDRNTYIDVLWDNIKPFLRHTYEIKQGWHPKSVTGSYDYYSIMHYGSGDFALRYGLATMKAKLMPHITHFGGNQITALDASKIKNMYNCPAYPDFPRDFYWSYDGRGTEGKTCVLMNEPDDIYWQKTSLCYNGEGKLPLGMRWSYKGPISGMRCERIFEPTKPRVFSWYDNYLCLPNSVPIKFTWKLTRPTTSERKDCLKIRNPRDATWNRKYHYLCASSMEEQVVDGKWSEWTTWSDCSRQCGGGLQVRERKCNNPAPANGGKFCEGETMERQECNKQSCGGLPSFPNDFTFGYHELPPFDDHCLRTYDMMDYFTWVNYYFCSSGSKGDPGFEWGMGRPIPGMRCTKIHNSVESRLRRGSWEANYLCVPTESPYRFLWSENGPIKDKQCMRWYAKDGRDGWNNTYLCKEGTSMRGR